MKKITLELEGLDGNSFSKLTQDGDEKFRGTYNDCLVWLQKHTSFSWEWNFKHEGWKIEPAYHCDDCQDTGELPEDEYEQGQIVGRGTLTTTCHCRNVEDDGDYSPE